VVAPNSRGFFEIRGVAPGLYTVSAEVPGPLVSESIELKVLRNTEAELAPLTLDRLHKVQIQVTPAKPPSADQWRMTLYSVEQNHHQTVVARTSVEPTGAWGSPGLRPGVYAVYVGVGQSGSFARREFRVEDRDSEITIDIPLTRVHGASNWVTRRCDLRSGSAASTAARPSRSLQMKAAISPATSRLQRAMNGS
jgi:hypothetical protein